MADENVAVYVDILVDSLKQKKQLLEKIYEVTENQKALLELSEGPDIATFEEAMDTKEIYINKLVQVENGFDSIYNRVSEVLKNSPVYYKEKIQVMQGLITEITALSVDIQAQEKRNKERFENFLKGKQQEIKQFNTSSKVAANYYKSMNSGGAENQSVFMDKKN